MDFKTPPFDNGLSPADTSHRLPNSRIHSPKESSPLAFQSLSDDFVTSSPSHSSYSDTTAGHEDSKPSFFISDCILDSSNLAAPSSINDATPLSPLNPARDSLPTNSHKNRAASLDSCRASPNLHASFESLSSSASGYIDDYHAYSSPRSSSAAHDAKRLYAGDEALESNLDERLDSSLDGPYPREGSKSYVVNSFHNYCLARLAAPLVPLAWAEDGCIEAFCHRDAPLFGILWHIERPEGLEFNPITMAWLRGFRP